MDAGRCATSWWRGQVTTLGSDLSVATATTHVVLTLGASTDVCWILSFPRSNKTAAGYYRQSASAGLTSSACSIKQGSEIPYQVSSGESGASRWNLKRQSWGWRSRPRCYKRSHPAEITHQPERSGAGATAADGEVLAIDKQEIETQVEVKAEKRWRWAAFLPVKINRVR